MGSTPTPLRSAKSLARRGSRNRACVRCQCCTQIRPGDRDAVARAAEAGSDEKPERSVGAWRDSADPTPGRLGAAEAVEEGKDAVANARVRTGVAGYPLSLKLRSTDEPIASRRGFGGQRDGGSAALPPGKVELDRPSRLDTPRLKSVERAVRFTPRRSREGKPGDLRRPTDIGGRDATAGQVEAHGRHEQRSAYSCGAPAHLRVSERVDTEGRARCVRGNRDRCLRRHRRTEPQRGQQRHQRRDGVPPHRAEPSTRPSARRNADVANSVIDALRIERHTLSPSAARRAALGSRRLTQTG